MVEHVLNLQYDTCIKGCEPMSFGQDELMLMLSMAVATERVIEISKPIVGYDKKKHQKYLPMATIAVATGLAYMNLDALMPIFPFVPSTYIVLTISVGLISAGSSVINDLISISTSFNQIKKDQRNV